MAVWEVRSNERSVDMDAPNWMMAMGMAMAGLGDDAPDLSCLICDIQPDGVVRIFEPKQDTALLVRRKPDDLPVLEVPDDGDAASLIEEAFDAPDPVLAPSGGGDGTELPEPSFAAGPSADALDEPAMATASLSDLHAPGTATPDGVLALGPEAAAEPAEAVEEFVVAEDEEEDEEVDASLPPPALTMPTTPSAAFEDIGTLEEPSAGFDDEDLAFVWGIRRGIEYPGPPPDLAEQLFDLGFDIASSDSIQHASQSALELLQRFIPAESGCVLLAGINDTALRFVAATGPAAEEVMHLTIPFGDGIAGFCHNNGADMIVRDAAHDPRHLREVEEQTGYRARAVLAAAVRDTDGDIHGCIELLNPVGRFHTWHLDAVRSVAHTLAEYIGPRM